jgi:hypothetical protein
MRGLNINTHGKHGADRHQRELLRVREVELQRLLAQARLAAGAALELERRRGDAEVGREQHPLGEVCQFAASLLLWVVQRDDPDVDLTLAKLKIRRPRREVELGRQLPTSPTPCVTGVRMILPAGVITHQ